MNNEHSYRRGHFSSKLPLSVRNNGSVNYGRPIKAQFILGMKNMRKYLVMI